MSASQAKTSAGKQPVPANADVKPWLGATVLVTTPEKIGGQNEHAAMVTQVHADDVVNVMLNPGNGFPYPIPAVRHVRHSAAASLHWRWPPRS